jgi:NDP-sugar pyrophosphorylase family protein
MTVWQDCGVPEKHLEANRWLLDHGSDNSNAIAAALSNSEIVPPVHVDGDVEIADSVIGPYAVVESGSRITGSHLRDTIVMAGATVAHSQLHDSLLGERVIVKGIRASLMLSDDSVVDSGS